MIKEAQRMNVFAIITIIIATVTAGQILMKTGMNQVGRVELKELLSPKIFKIVFNKFVFLGLALYGISSLFYLVALSMENVSYVYPLIGLGYILTAVLAWIIFGESLTFMRVMGILLISLGAYFVVVKL